jgi:hypothetical protein
MVITQKRWYRNSLIYLALIPCPQGQSPVIVTPYSLIAAEPETISVISWVMIC